MIFFRRLEEHARKTLRDTENGPSEEELEDMVTNMISIFLVIPGLVSPEMRAKTIVILKDMDIALMGLLKMLHREPGYGIWTDQHLLNVFSEENWAMRFDFSRESTEEDKSKREERVLNNQENNS